jgi:protein-L-isoaspartate O-methyltransferase
VALDERTAAPDRVAAAALALRPGGRLVAPVGAAVPEGVTELARDGRHWVAERTAAAPPLVPLGRR